MYLGNQAIGDFRLTLNVFTGVAVEQAGGLKEVLEFSGHVTVVFE